MSYGTCVNGTLPMSYDIYVNGEYADYFGSATTWDDAARFIKRTTPANTPLHRLAEEGETHEPEEAATMLADLLKRQYPAPGIARPLLQLLRLMTGRHVAITNAA
jgi:hypothetical protein